MIIFTLFLASFSIFPDQLLNLSKLALSKSFLKQNRKYEKKIFYPGKYQYDRISFEVKNFFTSINNVNIKSFALDPKLQAIALVLNNDDNGQIITNGSFLSDEETSQIYQLKEKIGNDDKVTIYRYQSTNIFNVLTNIKIVYNSEEQLLKEDNFNNNNSYYSIGYPKNCSYDELKQIQTNFIPYINSNNDENVSIGVKIGGFTSFSTSYEFTFKSIEEFYSKIKFSGEAKMESGFHFTNSTVKIDNLKISATELHTKESDKIVLNHYIFEIFGFQLTIDFYLNFILHIDEISIDSSPDFYLTSSSKINFNKEYEYSSLANEKIFTKSNSYNFQIDYNLLNDEKDDFDNFKIRFKPIIDLYVSADIKFIFTGNDPTSTTIETGVRNSYDVNVDHLNEENCFYPYLTYSYIPYLYNIFFISNDVNINSVTLIKNMNLNFRNYWIGEQIGPRCLYRCYNADSNISIDLPVFYSNEINNTNSNQLNFDFFVGDNKFDVDVKGDKKLDFLKKVDSKDDNLTFYGNFYDPSFSNSLLLTFYPKKFQSSLYFDDQMTTITDFYFIKSNFFFKFYQGIELKMFEEVHPNATHKFAFVESPFNVSLIQHMNVNNQRKYVVNKMNISDDQYSTEEKFSYYLKNNWKMKISDTSIKMTVMLINYTSNITEKSFLYDENVVFNMDNRKLGLLVEFENEETKFILIDIDLSWKKQIELTEEFYLNRKIKITLIPHVPYVFFDLDCLLNLNEIGLIAAPILDSDEIYSFELNKEIKNSIDKVTETWKYLIYHLKTDFQEDLMNETLFIVISSIGFYPLNAKEEFANNIYLLEFTEFIFEKGYLVFYIPFVRKSDYKDDDEIVVLSIFAQPLINDAFCPHSFHYSQFNSKIALGCIENNIDFESTLILTAIDQTGKQYIPTQMLFEQDAYIYVNLFNQKSEMLCIIARLPSIFPEDSLTLSIDNLLIDALTSYSFNSLKIKCQRCSGIFRNGESYLSNDDQEIEIKIIEENYDDYYAICSNSADKFCIQKLSLNPNKVTLINRPMVTNFESLNFLENLPEILIPKAQLFSTYGKNLLIYSKDTKYGLSIANELNPQINLKLKAETRGSFYRLYTVTSANVFFPFSPISILSSFAESLKQLGLNQNDFSFYKIRDEIFINNKNAFLSLPKNPSSNLLYGLDSSVITSISTDYQLSSLNPQTYQTNCLCFVDTISQTCRQSGYHSCTNYLKLTPHEYNNFDVYFPENNNGQNFMVHIERDINDFYPDLRVFPPNTWKLFFTSTDPHTVSGSFIIPYTDRLDSIDRIDCSNLDVIVEVNLQDQRYGHPDFSSSKSRITITIKIINEFNYRINNVNSYFNRESLIANTHYLQKSIITKSSKRISTKSQYTYRIVDIYSYRNDGLRGHYKFYMALEKDGYHLNDNFCFYDTGSPNCVSGSLNTGSKTFHTIGDMIDSYPDKINYITVEIVNSDRDFYSDNFLKLSNKHQNIFLTLKSSTSAVIKSAMIVYHNLNISFEGNLDISQLTLQQQVKVGFQTNISLNNKRVTKVEVTTICPDKEIGFDKKQIIIKGFNSANQYSLSGTSCNLAHSTLTLSLGVDSDLYLNINQKFNSYPTEYCLFSTSPSKCNPINGFIVRNNNFNTNYIQSGKQVTITIVDDYEINLNFQSKSVIFIGLHNKVKLFGTLTLSSDSTVSFQNIDISELDLIFSFDISNNRITSFNFILCNTLPNSFECKLTNPNSNLLETKFADLNIIENISLKWIPVEISYNNIIISTEIKIINEDSAFIKLNHIVPRQVLCYYTSDSSHCPSISTIIQPSNMWQNYNDSLIYISDYLDISNVDIKDNLVYFTSNGQIKGKLTFSGSSLCHFIDNYLTDSLIIETQVDFESKKAPKIVFGYHKANLGKWNLIINGYDFTSSFCLFENKNLLPDEIRSNVDSNIVIVNKNYNTEIQFIQLYEPNHFCVYDYPYESICLTKFPKYFPIKSSDLWDMKLNSIEMPKIVFASKSNSMFLPLKKFKDENIQSTLIEVLSFSSFPTFLVPEDFSLIIIGDSSELTAKVSIDTTTLKHGKIIFNEVSKIKLIPTDKTVFYDDNSLILLNENNYLSIFYEIQRNDLYDMNEIVLKSITKNYDYDSESIDDLYNDESTELKTLKLTKETVLNYSNLKNKKLGIFGSNNVLSLTANSIPSFLSLLLINSSTIIFDSVLHFEIGIFNSNVNLYPFAIKEQISPEMSLKYRNSIDVYDGSSIKIEEDKIILNDEEFSFDNNKTLDLHLNDFCSINDSIGKTINFYGTKCLFDIERIEDSSYLFNEFEVLMIKSNNGLSNISFYNISLLNFDSNIEISIDYYYIHNQTSGNLLAKKTPINIKQIDLYGKPFYCDESFVDSLNVYENKSLIKGVKLSDSLHINCNASLIAHSSTFLSTISAHFHLSTESPLLVLVNSTFDCDELIIYFDYSYQNEDFVLIKGLESLDHCEYIKNKIDESKFKINYDLSCRINEIDELVDLVASNCTVFSKEFTVSNYFTESVDFSNSLQFTYSNYFSKTNEFSSTLDFTFSEDFSNSNEFTISSKFTKSNDFTSTNIFSFSSIFSMTNEFSNTIDFTFSEGFSYSNEFTISSKFTKSNDFPSTSIFSYSNIFSKTTEFSISSQFSYSEIFTNSQEFTSSNFFITQTFSVSNYFTDSSGFTSSAIFSLTQTFKETINPYVTYSRSIVMSYSIIRTVVFSYLNSYSVSYINCFDENGVNSFCLTDILTYSYFPYIIHSYKTTLVVTYLPFLIRPRRGITKEQLIGITCISAAVFFGIIGIIIMAVKKSHHVSDDFSISSEDNGVVEKNDEIQNTKSETNMKSDDDDYNLNFWL